MSINVANYLAELDAQVARVRRGHKIGEPEMIRGLRRMAELRTAMAETELQEVEAAIVERRT